MKQLDRLDDILGSKTKIKVLRFFILGKGGQRVTGRQIAKAIKVSPPAAHAALKSLYREGLVNREIISRQHIYSLNQANRLVKDILKPSFGRELS